MQKRVYASRHWNPGAALADSQSHRHGDYAHASGGNVLTNKRCGIEAVLAARIEAEEDFVRSFVRAVPDKLTERCDYDRCIAPVPDEGKRDAT